jgi:aspartate 1-decarboxylase
MTREMLRAKIHRITVTECDVEYEGSVTVDVELMERAGMVPYERVEVYDVDNGSRFATYLIEGPRGSGICAVNGAAARLTAPGHKAILATYCTLAEEDVPAHAPRIVLVDADNRATVVKSHEGAGVRVPA